MSEEKRRLSQKRIEQWTMEDSKRELAKYCRSEDDAGQPGTIPESVCDPLVDLVAQQRQTFTLQFVQSLGSTMDRYAKWQALATEAAAGYFERDEVKAMFAPRGRIINLPVTVIPDDPKEAAALAAAEEEDDDSSSSDSSTPIEPSADAPKLPPLDNTLLSQHLQSLMVEARALDLAVVHLLEWFTLNLSAYDEQDEETAEVLAKMLEELSDTRSVASDRYEFYSTYLEVRAEVESNMLRYPDVQTYRELMVARDHAAWEEVIRSWGLLLSAVAMLDVTLSRNLKYILAEEEDEVHNAAESSLFM